MAQTNNANVQQSVDELTTRYQLDSDQVKEMYVIQERKERNLGEIESLKESNSPLFFQKKQAIRENTLGSIRRMLNEEQRLMLDQEKIAYRKETSEFIRQYRAEGKSKEEIELLLLERG